ncbi:CDP-alcohol phosphatidyltransferase family protein [Sneathiella limimaris]|uniref:CDP-alcohol phosphatidyltransferase family protein n=1 Tax=Sneathiella limimaris TaxID=1964213 RepID=UPI00146BF42A|nr:CDP-alcohol phosphatidyltransferase family protein [Sneathiella limimaris]
MKKNFESQDFSATAPTLRKWATDPILNLIPETVSPNALTLFGGICAGITAFLLWFSKSLIDPTTSIGKTLLVLGALLLVVYAICDQLDGLQARRLKRGGPAGDFLDHWVDAFLANITPIALMYMMVYPLEQMVIMSLVVTFAFWTNNWETRNNHARKLPFLGGLEFIWVGVVCLIVTAIWGYEIWDETIFEVELRHLSYAVVISVLSFSIFKNCVRARDHLKDLLTPALSLGTISIWLIYSHHQGALTWNTQSLAFLTLALMGVRHTGDLMRALWLNSRIKDIEPLFVLPGICLVLIAVLQADIDVLRQLETPTLIATALLVIWLTAFQAIHTFTVLVHGLGTEKETAEGQPPSVQRIMVDMSATLLHHGHIRLLNQAKKLGHVVIGLTSDTDLQRVKGVDAELSFAERKEILLALEAVDEVVETPWLLTEEVLKKHNIDLLVHGDDNQNDIDPERLIIFPRTDGISSSTIRERAARNLQAENA